jgi:hypothetical protein
MASAGDGVTVCQAGGQGGGSWGVVRYLSAAGMQFPNLASRGPAHYKDGRHHGTADEQQDQCRGVAHSASENNGWGRGCSSELVKEANW